MPVISSHCLWRSIAMALKSLEDTFKEYPDLDEQGQELIAGLRAVLDGKVKRDVLHNSGESITRETLDTYNKEFAAFMNDPKNSSLLIKD
jgi:hypothetical protein